MEWLLGILSYLCIAVAFYAIVYVADPFGTREDREAYVALAMLWPMSVSGMLLYGLIMAVWFVLKILVGLFARLETMIDRSPLRKTIMESENDD